MLDFQEQLLRAIARGLPGEKAHIRMAPFRPLSSIARKAAENVRESAVAVVIYEQSDTYYCILIQRPSYEGNHSGQISFPGGKKDLSDNDLQETAIRECMEETGVELSQARFLGQLTPVYIPVSNFHVEPFVFFYPEVPQFTPDPREVESIMSISLQALTDESSVQFMTVILPDGSELKEVPCFRIDDMEIWGATALMLNELKEVLLGM